MARIGDPETAMSDAMLLAIGAVAGALVLAVVVWRVAPRAMLGERASRYGLAETVDRLVAAARAEGWTVSGVSELDKSVREQGGPAVRPVRLVNLCHPEHAARILAEDGARIVSVMMPCTISVYEKGDGSVWVGHMRPGLMGRVFGGVVAKVMAGPVARAQAGFIDAVC
jgi:uncharacterized protein (DUF302 family)